MKKSKAQICYHPNLYPTGWNQNKPAPCKMDVLCECGESQICPVCGWGTGGYPCTCMREHRKENNFEVSIEMVRDYLENEGIGTGTNITYHACKCLIRDFVNDKVLHDFARQSIKEKIEQYIKDELPYSDEKFHYQAEIKAGLNDFYKYLSGR